MLTPVGANCHRRYFLTSVPPPEPVCDYVPVAGDLCLAS
jgi:hypothetical protein